MKYYRLPSVDEILLIDGIGGSDYDKLSAYVTVNGPRDEFAINVNRAGKPVLMSILGPDDESFPITEDTADNIVRRRELSPFDVGSFKDFTGKSFSSDRVTTTGKVFTIKSTASSGGVKRIIETVFNMSSGKIEYWKEY